MLRRPGVYAHPTAPSPCRFAASLSRTGRRRCIVLPANRGATTEAAVPVRDSRRRWRARPLPVRKRGGEPRRGAPPRPCIALAWLIRTSTPPRDEVSLPFARWHLRWAPSFSCRLGVMPHAIFFSLILTKDHATNGLAFLTSCRIRACEKLTASHKLEEQRSNVDTKDAYRVGRLGARQSFACRGDQVADGEVNLPNPAGEDLTVSSPASDCRVFAP